MNTLDLVPSVWPSLLCPKKATVGGINDINTDVNTFICTTVCIFTFLKMSPQDCKNRNKVSNVLG